MDPIEEKTHAFFWKAYCRADRLLPLLTTEPEISQEMFTIINTWMIVATFLVFIMGPVHRVAAVGGFCLTSSCLFFKGIEKIAGLRVSEEAELVGLDLHEHGVQAYTGMSVSLPN